LGRAQAALLRDRLARTGEVVADVLASSTLPRAIETAEIIAPALAGSTGQTPELVRDCDLCELHPGECDNLGWDEYAERYGVDMLTRPFEPMSPGGESLAEFNLRVGRALTALADEHEGRSVVVACHGGVVMSSMKCFLGLPILPSPAVKLLVANTSITEWQRRDGRWGLVRYNDAAHLAATEDGPSR
ncbi:MAG TPA: histidine phosphatase family protein, partial [Acidimicrobiales bacterium]|nr:histidine phosphatase family protein [Acidimicrobiales bacterium]